MKVFISSIVRGLEPFRDAVARAASVLRHEVKRSEDFGASTDTPQQACLAGVRWADVVVLLLGARYGDRQPSGISATHEEYQKRNPTGDDEVLAGDPVGQGRDEEPARVRDVGGRTPEPAPRPARRRPAGECSHTVRVRAPGRN